MSIRVVNSGAVERGKRGCAARGKTTWRREKCAATTLGGGAATGSNTDRARRCAAGPCTRRREKGTATGRHTD